MAFEAFTNALGHVCFCQNRQLLVLDKSNLLYVHKTILKSSVQPCVQIQSQIPTKNYKASEKTFSETFSKSVFSRKSSFSFVF